MSITTEMTSPFNTIEEALDAIKAGEIIIVVDDEDRENEGDFICAAEKITPEKVNFMARYGRGLICTPVTEARAKELNLNKMVSDNTALHETAFTVSIDYLKKGCTTGISAYDRSTGIAEIVNSETKPTDYARPGHIFPLIAKDGGVLRRTGHTEAAVDLAGLAGLYPAGVLVEILNEDGSMARLPQLTEIAKEHSLKLINIKDLIEYRLKTETLIKVAHQTKITNKYGEFDVTVFEDCSGDVHLAIHKGDLAAELPCLTRMHATSKSFGPFDFILSGYMDKVETAFKHIAEEGRGIIVLMQQGQDETSVVDRLRILESEKTYPQHRQDVQKDYGVGAQILRHFGVSDIKLLTSHPKKRIALTGYGLEIVEYVGFDA